MARTRVVTLSDGLDCEVRRLGIFELDGKGPELLGPFRYTFTLANGQEVEEEYNLYARTKPPKHPGVPEDEIVERSPEWWQLLEWQTYRAAVAHEQERLDAAAEFVEQVSTYIVEHALSPKDRDRVVTEEDWLTVTRAALVPEIKYENVADAFRKHFLAHFDGKEVFDALDEIEGGHGGYNALRLWEMEAMRPTGMTEEEWADLSHEERVRRVAAVALPKLMGSLEADRSVKEARRGST